MSYTAQQGCCFETPCIVDPEEDCLARSVHEVEYLTCEDDDQIQPRSTYVGTSGKSLQVPKIATRSNHQRSTEQCHGKASEVSPCTTGTKIKVKTIKGGHWHSSWTDLFMKPI